MRPLGARMLAVGAIFAVSLNTMGFTEEDKTKGPAKVIAEVGKAKITLEQFQEVIDTSAPNARQAVLKQKDKLLEEVVNQELIFQEAQAINLIQDTTVQKSLEGAKRQFLLQRMLQIRLQDKVNVTPQEVKDYYDKNKEKFVAPERVRAAHILVKDEKLAKGLLQKIQKGADFDSLAMENSIDPSKVNGGDLGFFTRGRMIPEFEKAAFDLKEGAVSDVVPTKFGYHIIKSIKKVPASPLEFAEIKDRLTRQLLNQKQQQEISKFIQELRQKTAIKTHPELLEQVK